MKTKSNPVPHTVVCAWCKKVLFSGGTTISHGICGDCLDGKFPQIAWRLREKKKLNLTLDNGTGSAIICL